MEFIDTHAHLYLEQFASDVDEVIQRAIDDGVSKIILPNIDKASMPLLLELAGRYPDVCVPLPGVHPTYVKADFEKELQAVAQELQKAEYKGVGEIGIDLYWDKTFYKEQQKAFESQLHLAMDHELPVVIHARDSFDEILEILRKTEYKKLTGVFHAFTGTDEQAKEIIGHGLYLGIGGIVTFKNSNLSGVIEKIPLEHLVLETDAPYLAPTPYRGKRNESSYVKLIAEHIAKCKRLNLERVAELTTQNAKALFNL